MIEAMSKDRSLARAAREARAIIVRGARAFLSKNIYALGRRRRKRLENEAVRAWFTAVRRCRSANEQAILLYYSYRRALGDAIDKEAFAELSEGGEAAAEVADFYNRHFREPDEPGLTAESIAAYFEELSAKGNRYQRVRNKYDKAQSRLNERFACSLCVRHHPYADDTCGAMAAESFDWTAIFEEFQRALLTHEDGCGCKVLDQLADGPGEERGA